MLSSAGCLVRRRLRSKQPLMKAGVCVKNKLAAVIPCVVYVCVDKCSSYSMLLGLAGGGEGESSNLRPETKISPHHTHVRRLQRLYPASNMPGLQTAQQQTISRLCVLYTCISSSSSSSLFRSCRSFCSLSCSCSSPFYY